MCRLVQTDVDTQRPNAEWLSLSCCSSPADCYKRLVITHSMLLGRQFSLPCAHMGSQYTPAPVQYCSGYAWSLAYTLYVQKQSVCKPAFGKNRIHPSVHVRIPMAPGVEVLAFYPSDSACAVWCTSDTACSCTVQRCFQVSFSRHACDNPFDTLCHIVPYPAL